MTPDKRKRFFEKAGSAALFMGAVLLPIGTFVIEGTTHLCERFSGFDLLATPWHIMMAAFASAILLVLWLAVRGKLRVPETFFRLLATGVGVALTFCALFWILATISILAETPLRALGICLLISLIPPIIFIHTPLVALISGLALFRQWNEKARQQGVPVFKNLCAGALIGVGLSATFFAMDADTAMITGTLPKPSWKMDAEKRDLLLERAGQGDGEASCRIGVCYATGRGVEQDIEKAVEWYVKAFEQGYTAAICFLNAMHGRCPPYHYNGMPSLKGIVYRKDVKFQFHQGIFYLEKDNARAVSWFEQAARQGHPMAHILLERHNENAIISLDDAFEAFDVIQAMFVQSGNYHRLRQRLEDRTDAHKRNDF